VTARTATRGTVIRFADGRRSAVVVTSDLEHALAAHLPPGTAAVALLGDDQVGALHGQQVTATLRGLVGRVVSLTFPAGEASKTRATKAALEDRMVAAGLGRDTCVVALGGGVSTDLAGFVAATYMRGVPLISVPTSLLAMVDAAIGGKCGVNTRHGKNLVGALHQPTAVLLHPPLLRTLPRREWVNGLAEVVKVAVVARDDLVIWLEEHAPGVLAGAPGATAHMLDVSATVKGEVVARDERERGPREVLNFGHTMGHALEKAVGPSLSHGRAVALGMRVEARISALMGGLKEAEVTRLEALLSRLELLEAAPAVPFERLRPFLEHDKKNRGGELRMALPSALGAMLRGSRGRYSVAVDPKTAGQAWEAVRCSV